MSDRLGGKPVMTMSLLATGICTALLTVAASFGSTALVLVLFIEGMLQGPTFPTNAVRFFLVLLGAMPYIRRAMSSSWFTRVRTCAACGSGLAIQLVVLARGWGGDHQECWGII